MARTRRVLVTGVGRWWGALAARRLAESREVAEVVGIDVNRPRHDLGRASYLQVDVRHGVIGRLVRAVGIDTVLHTGTTIDSFDLDARRAHETNVIGTLNLLAGCAGADSPVRRFVLKSSGHVYGAGPDVPPYVDEDRAQAFHSPHAFVRDIAELEAYLGDFSARHPEVAMVELRFANSLNAGEPQPLARYLALDPVPAVIGHDPVLQLIDRDDCVEAMARAVLSDAEGAFNIAARDGVRLTELLAATGKVHIPLLPPVCLPLAARALRMAGVAFLSPQLLDLVRWGRTMSTVRAARQLRFRAAHSTTEAFERFVAATRAGASAPAPVDPPTRRDLETLLAPQA